MTKNPAVLRALCAMLFFAVTAPAFAQATRDANTQDNRLAEAPTLLRATNATAPKLAAASTVLRQPGVLRFRAVDIDFALLRRTGDALAQNGEAVLLRLPLFDDASYVAELTRTERTASGGLAQTGRILGADYSTVTLVDNGGVVSFNLSLADRRYTLHGSADTGYWVRELGTTERPDHPPGGVPAPIVPQATGKVGGIGQPSVRTDTGDTIDVLVVYTAAARNANGGKSQIEANIDAQVAFTNTIYANSNVVQRLRLVYKGEVDLVESTTMQTDLTKLQSAGDGAIDEVPTLRNLYGADLVSMWGIYTDYCGLGNFMSSEATAFGATSGYNVVASPACTSANYPTFAHELGHNMGLHHDLYVANTPATSKVTPEGSTTLTTITYGHGYVDMTNRFRTVMSYPDQCTASSFTCVRVPYFSNPAISYNNTANYGPAVTAPTGLQPNSDEHQVLNDTRETVANFRASLASLIGPGTVAFLPTSSFRVLRSAGQIRFRVARHAGSSGAISVNYATADGTGIAGVDYTATSGTLSWAAGDTADKFITVPLATFVTLAPTRTFTLNLSAPAGGANILSASGTTGAAGSATAVVVDDGLDTFPVSGKMPAGFTSPDSNAWTVANDQSYAGLYSLKSAPVFSASGDFTNYTYSDLDYTGTFQAGALSFFYKVSSYPSYEQFDFMIDGVVVLNSNGGEVDWKSFVTTLTAGTHTLRWRYKSRLPFTCAGSTPAPPGGLNCADRVWIDSVVLPAAAPQIALAKRGGIDIDGDGKAEIIVQSTGTQLQAGRLVNNALVFTPLAGPSAATYRLVGIGDFDGNGKSDLAFQNMVQDATFGDVRTWPTFSGTGETFWRQVKKVWDVQAVGDLDGDGFGDLVWRYVVTDSPDTGVSYIWFSNGVSVTQVRKRGGAPLNWKLLGAADLNGDGAADMIYISPEGLIKTLMATPSRTCANLSAGSVPTGFTPLKLADFTGNGRADILMRNAANGATQLLTLSAAGLALPAYTGAPDDQNASCTASSLSLNTITLALPVAPAGWTLYATGDLNGDGITDIVWLQADGTLTVWLMSANGGAPTVIGNAGAAPAGYTVFQP